MLKKYIWVVDSLETTIYRKNKAKRDGKTWRGQFYATKITDDMANRDNNTAEQSKWVTNPIGWLLRWKWKSLDFYVLRLTFSYWLLIILTEAGSVRWACCWYC